MRQNFYLKLAGLLIILTASFTFMVPAKAFYLEMPKFFKDAVSLIQSVNAEDKIETIAPAEQQINNEVQPPSIPVNESYASDTGSTGVFNQPQTCRINGVEQPGACKPEDKMNDNNGMSGGQGWQGDNGDKNEQDRQDQQNKQDEQNNQRMLKDTQRGARDIERQLKQFESMVAKFVKKGVVISEEIKTKITDLKSLVEKIKAATTVEEAAGIDTQEMWDKMRELEEERQNLERIDNVMREMRRIESNIKMFEKQVQKLVKQKLAVSEEIATNLEQVKALIVDIKNGKMENAEDIFDLMQTLDEHRGELEMLSRWPQTVKQMDRELKNLMRELKRVKPIVDRLGKKGIDLASVYGNFESGVNQLKDVKGASGVKVTENAEEAFDMVQNDFFGQLEDVWENDKIIMTMSNLGRFNSDFKRQVASANSQINALKKKKIDTSELKDILEQAKAKGAEALELFKVKPIDPDAVISALEEIQNLNQDFSQKVAELTGEEEDMPWEKGQQQFKKIDISPNLNNWIPKTVPQQQISSKQQEQQTCNINGVETQGPCDGLSTNSL